MLYRYNLRYSGVYVLDRWFKWGIKDIEKYIRALAALHNDDFEFNVYTFDSDKEIFRHSDILFIRSIDMYVERRIYNSWFSDYKIYIFERSNTILDSMLENDEAYILTRQGILAPLRVNSYHSAVESSIDIETVNELLNDFNMEEHFLETLNNCYMLNFESENGIVLTKEMIKRWLLDSNQIPVKNRRDSSGVELKYNTLYLPCRERLIQSGVKMLWDYGYIDKFKLKRYYIPDEIWKEAFREYKQKRNFHQLRLLKEGEDV